MPGRRRGGDSNDERLRGLGAQTSDTVKQAADVLERELSAGLEEARTLQQKFVDGRSLTDGDLDDVTARVRRNAHTVIDVVSDRVTEMSAGDVQDLGTRFTKDAHQLLDSLLDFVGASPGLLADVVKRVQVTDPGPDADAPSPPPDPARPAARTTTPRKAAARKTTPSKAAARTTTARKAAARKTTARTTTPSD